MKTKRVARFDDLGLLAEDYDENDPSEETAFKLRALGKFIGGAIRERNTKAIAKTEGEELIVDGDEAYRVGRTVTSTPIIY